MLVQKENIPSSYSSNFFFIKTLDYKQLLDEVFVISRSRKVLSAEPKDEADNTYLDLNYLGYHRNRI